MSNQESQGFDAWAIVEVMGHQTYAGRVTEQTVAGQAFVRIDVPAMKEVLADEGRRDPPEVPAYTKLLGPSSIYAITPTSEEVARAAARKLRKEPISVYVPELYPPRETRAALHGAAVPFDDAFDDE